MTINGRYRPAVGGHAPGHLREGFCDAVDAFEAWEPGQSEPCVAVGYGGREMPIRQVFGLLWNCTDCMPGVMADQIADFDGEPLRNRSYAAGARRMKALVSAA